MKPLNMLVDFLVHVGIFTLFYAVITDTYMGVFTSPGMLWILLFSFILLIVEIIVDKLMWD